MLKKLKQKLLFKNLFRSGTLHAGKVLFGFIIVAGSFIILAPKTFATDFPINNITVKTDIEINGKKDNLIKVVKGQSVKFTVDVTVVEAKDSANNPVSQIVLGTDNLDFNVDVSSKRPIKALGAGLGNGSNCSGNAIYGITTSSSTFLDCDFSTASSKISSGTIKVGQQYQMSFDLTPAKLSELKINSSQTSGSTQSVRVYPYFDMDVLLSGTHAVSFSNAGKEVYLQFFNTQSELDASGTTRPGDVKDYGSNTGNAGSQKGGDAITSLINRIVLIIAGIVNQFIYFIFYWLIAPLIQAMLSIHTYQDQFVNVIYPGWEIVRNICNILFIIAIIAMGLGTLLRFENYQWRHLIVQLVIAALLVNFSLVIAQAILAFADTIQSQFLPNNVDVIRSLARDLMVTNTQNALGQSITTAGSFADTVQYLFWVSLSIGSFLVFAAMVAFLIVRVVAIWVLLMLSPIAYVARILPTTKGISGTWWQTFLKYAFFTPVLAFFLNMAAVISNSARNSPVLQQITSASFSDSNMPNLSKFVFAVASNVIILVFLILAIRVASQFGVVGGDVLKDIGEKGVKFPFTWTGKKVKQGTDYAKQGVQNKSLQLANRYLGPSEKDSGKPAGFFKRQAYNIMTGGAVSKAKKKAREESLHDEQHKTEAYAKAYKQQASGKTMDSHIKYEREHFNSAVKKEKDLLQDLDADQMKEALEKAFKNEDPHAKAIQVQAIVESSIKEGTFEDMIEKKYKSKDITNLYNDMETNQHMHAPDINRIGTIVNREMMSKGKYQHVIKAKTGRPDSHNPTDKHYFANLGTVTVTDNDGATNVYDQNVEVTENRKGMVSGLSGTEKAQKVHQTVYFTTNDTGDITGVNAEAGSFAMDFKTTEQAQKIASEMKSGQKNDYRKVLGNATLRAELKNKIFDLLPGGAMGTGPGNVSNQSIANNLLTNMDAAI